MAKRKQVAATAQLKQTKSELKCVMRASGSKLSIAEFERLIEQDGNCNYLNFELLTPLPTFVEDKPIDDVRSKDRWAISMFDSRETRVALSHYVVTNHDEGSKSTVDLAYQLTVEALPGEELPALPNSFIDRLRFYFNDLDIRVDWRRVETKELAHA